MTAAKIRDARTGRLRKATDLDQTRLRFNAGYHDGAHDAGTDGVRFDGLTVATIREGHFDPAYAEGWVAGWNDAKAGRSAESSEPAWQRERSSATLSAEYAAYRPGRLARVEGR